MLTYFIIIGNKRAVCNFLVVFSTLPWELRVLQTMDSKKRNFMRWNYKAINFNNILNSTLPFWFLTSTSNLMKISNATYFLKMFFLQDSFWRNYFAFSLIVMFQFNHQLLTDFSGVSVVDCEVDTASSCVFLK